MNLLENTTEIEIDTFYGKIAENIKKKNWERIKSIRSSPWNWYKVSCFLL